MMQEKSEWHIRFEGQVQGVGFRSAVKKLAIPLQIAGYVRNCPDGAVEVCAQGTEKTLQSFVDQIQSRAGRAVIERVFVEKADPATCYSSFDIR
jgi:acylphosphatase